MKTSTILRASLLAAGLGAALSAHALSIELVSDGRYEAQGSNSQGVSYFSLQTVRVDTATSLPILATMELSWNDGTKNGPADGGGVYRTASGEDGFYVAFDVHNEDTVGIDFVSYGRFEFFSGFGRFAGVYGTGGFTNRRGPYNNGGDFSCHLVGDITPVPEPASMAALGVGAVAMLRRRKKA